MIFVLAEHETDSGEMYRLAMFSTRLYERCQVETSLLSHKFERLATNKRERKRDTDLLKYKQLR